MRPTVKICGFMREEDVHTCIRHGLDIAGFVVEYPHPVPWNLSVDTAKKLIQAVCKQVETCIVTGGSSDKIIQTAMEIKPTFIQLHNNETLEETAYLVNELGKQNIKIIKSLFPNTPNLEQTAKDFCDTGIHALLFDSRTPDNAANSGAANISTFMKLQSAVNCPVFLAGGINPQNVTEIVSKTKAQFIDLMTGVEYSHGIKDEKKVIALFKALE